MIRPATVSDLPAILDLVGALHRVTAMPLPINEAVAMRFLRQLVAAPTGMLDVADLGRGPVGFLAATVGFASISAAPLAMEHGWYCAPEAKGGGLRLLMRYEAWALQQGCRMIRMST